MDLLLLREWLIIKNRVMGSVMHHFDLDLDYTGRFRVIGILSSVFWSLTITLILCLMVNLGKSWFRRSL